MDKEFLEALNANDTGYLTGKQLHQLIEKEFSVNCCLRTVYNTLHRLNFSWITSRSKHPKSDKEVQELYKKLSRISQQSVAKKVELSSVDIWQQDETRVGQQGSLTRIWAPKGTRPRKLNSNSSYRRTYMALHVLKQVSHLDWCYPILTQMQWTYI